MRSAVLAGALLTTAALGSACVVSVDSQGQIVREEKRFKVTGTPELRLTTFDGGIEIQAWDRSDVAVDVEKRGATKEAVDALEVKTSQEGNRIELEVKRPRAETFSGFGFHQSASAKLIVSVPREVDIIARSGDGSIKIERVSGRLELRTGDGTIRAVDVGGELILDTGDGSVTVEGGRGRLEVDTGDGGVNVAGLLTAVKLHTGDGSIIYRAEPGSEMSENWEITTGDGGVTLYLPQSFGAEIDAHTGDGAIRNDLDILGGPEHERGENRRTLRGRLGSGGRQIRVRTGDGTIRLRPS
ncbi:MAG TPA: DUF4097 family beta strand repeat-containing protein [Vicinamibacterales bacterium]|nr:DUF4097 family beta strand repeat-containing protein [Vicinamibacterales bacterium]